MSNQQFNLAEDRSADAYVDRFKDLMMHSRKYGNYKQLKHLCKRLLPDMYLAEETMFYEIVDMSDEQLKEVATSIVHTQAAIEAERTG